MSDITSVQNPKIKKAAKLMNRRERDLTKRFLIEGAREIQRASEKNFPIETLFFCEAFSSPQEHALISQFQKKGIETYSCTESVFKKISYRENPDGFLAIAVQIRKGLDALDPILAQAKNPLLLVAESVEKPGNLGTLLRSCDAAGVDALILSDKLTDIYNPNVVRASVGTLFSIPIIETTGEEAISYLKAKGIKIHAATPEGAITYTDCSLIDGSAIVVGTEHEGLSTLWKNNADSRICIPMLGIADSLNVSVAATLILYEALRQRKA